MNNNKIIISVACFCCNMGDQTTKLCDFINVPNTQFISNPITSPEIKADSFEVSPGYLI
jgi:hypothetical protein